MQFVLNFVWVELLLLLSESPEGINGHASIYLKEGFPHVMSATNVQLVLYFVWVKLLLLLSESHEGVNGHTSIHLKGGFPHEMSETKMHLVLNFYGRNSPF